MDEHEQRRRRAKKRRGAAMSNQQGGHSGGNPLLVAIRRELNGHQFTTFTTEGGNALDVRCQFFPPEAAHYRGEDGEPRLIVRVDCSQPGHVCFAAPSAFDARESCNKTAIAAAVPELEQQLGAAGLTYHGGYGVAVPYITVPNRTVAADPMLAIGAIRSLLNDTHQLAPVMDRLVRTGHAAFDASTFARPEWTLQEYDHHLALLDRRGQTETAEHAERYTREVERRFARFVKRYGLRRGLVKRVLGQVGHSPRVLTAQLFRNQVVAINAQADFKAHPAMLKEIDRLLRQERWRT